MFHPMLNIKISNIAKSVYSQLGPGLPDRIYRESFIHELEDAEINYTKDPIVPIDFKGRTLNSGLYDCFIIERKIVIYIKSTPNYQQYDRQLMNDFLTLSAKGCGIILDFNSDNLAGVLRIFMNIEN